MPRSISPLVLLMAVAPAAAQGALCELAPVRQPDASPASDQFGHSLSVEGGRLVVGAPVDEDAGPTTSGSVWVLELQDGDWTPVQQLTASDATLGDFFGWSIALDGDRIVAGAYRDNVGGLVDAGSAYVFELAGSTWVEGAKLTGQGTNLAIQFGAAVAAEAGRVFVGAPYESHLGTRDGAVYVFERQGSLWTQTAKLGQTGPFPGQTEFGAALAADGDRLAVGEPAAPFDTGSNLKLGVTTLFRWTGTDWVVEDVLAAPTQVFNAPSDFGFALALDGDRLLVGDPDFTYSGPYVFAAGGAFVYERLGTQWLLDGLLQVESPATSDELGGSVALSGDRAAVGSPGIGPAGSVQLFERVGRDWVLAGELTAPSQPDGSRLGHSAGIAAARVLAGAPLDDLPTGEVNAGSVRSFGLAPRTWCTAKPSSAGCPPSIAASGSPSAVGPFTITATGVVNNKNGLFFYGLDGRAGLPFLGGTLCALPPLQRTPVSSSGGGPPPDDCSGVLAFDFAAWIAAGADPALAPGAVVNGQFWFRDPAQPDGTGVGLSDAVEFATCP